MDNKTTLGYLSVFGSAFCFYLATVIIKWSGIAGLTIDSSLFTFARFLVGFATVLMVMAIRRRKIKIVKKRYLFGRALGNCTAVYCFFKGVELTSVAQANILNMTYPIFVALISWTVMRRRHDPVAVAMVAVAFAGIWLILAPGKIDFKLVSLWGLVSGFTAALAMTYLNVSRQYHDTNMILFFMFGPIANNECIFTLQISPAPISCCILYLIKFTKLF